MRFPKGLKGYDIREPFRPFVEYTSAIVSHPVWWAASLFLVMSYLMGVPWIVIDGILTAGATILIFILQNSQRRDALAMQTKLDELIRVTDARTGLAGIENKEDRKIEETKKEIEELDDEVGSVKD